jgi:predicted  nucleic acid-binding Zn-ribbon protein
VESRRDSVHHYYWAKSNNEKKKMTDMDKEIVRVDGEINDLREKYKKKRDSLPRIIQKLI